MAILEIGFKPSSIGTSAAATLSDTRTLSLADYTSFGSTIPSVIQIQSGDTLVKIVAAGRATTNGVSGTGDYGAYVTSADALTHGALAFDGVEITTSVGTVAWYESAEVNIDLSAFAGQYLKPAVGPDNEHWRRCQINSVTSGMRSNNSAWPDPFGDGLNQNTGNPMYFVINRPDAPTEPEITAVNGDDTVSDASTGNTVTTSLGLDSVSAIVIRDADLNETAGSSIAGSGTSWTFATPAIADRSAAYYGSATLVLTGVYDSDPVELEFPITFNPPSGLTLTTLASDPDTSDQAVGYGIVTIAEGGQYVFDDTEAEIFNDALGYTIGDQSAQIAYVYDGTMTVFTLLTGSEASAGGFTAQGFTSQGFTAQGFTARGFA